jgi:transcription-repair coupling factor (superfamily II helicase)
MAHPLLLEAMRRQPAFLAVARNLPDPGDTLRIGGLAGSSLGLLVATLADGAANRQDGGGPRAASRLWTVVLPGPAEAEALEADLKTFLDGDRVALYPQRETLPYEAEDHHLEVNGLRVEALEALLDGRIDVLVTTVRALQERAEIPAALAHLRLSLNVGDQVRLPELAERLEALGFTRTPLVEGVGEYALRGGILDLFSFGAPEPVRVEFWGDEIVSLRRFDILDQLATAEIRSADILPVELKVPALEADADAGVERRSLLDLLPRDAVLLQWDPGAVEQELTRTWSQLLHLHQAERRRGARPERPESLFLPPAVALAEIERFGRLALGSAGEAEVRFQIREAEAVDRDMDRLLGLLRAGAARGEETLILCDNSGQLERLEEILGGRARGAVGLPPRATLALGSVARGFVLDGAEPPVRVLTDHEIFRRDRRLRRGRRFHGVVALESLSQLRPGDFVVHLDHGIGRFLGLERVKVGGGGMEQPEEIEALAIEYAGGEKLRVPVYRLDLIERWSPDREDPEPPKLHKIGGKTWKTLRKKTEQAIQEVATELLELYAARQLSVGHAYSADTRWQREMESSFLYEDTPDQRKATADVKRDMEAARPMDRLICGDVGYGKTEVAIRAAFKAVQDGKQVGVLAPTTILAEQHLRTFRERLADFPVRIEALSRFRTPKEQQEILAAAASGEVDVLIGTHRILEGDVVLRDLGLLVVDEEQRFGVRQKERLKEIAKQIDVLSMSATPIPRTLHLSLAGLRDLTLIQTPPRDRMPVITHVIPWIDEVIEDAILRELDRGGQVFFVHNRVQSIDVIAERVQRLVPEAAIGVAHGQMNAAELDDVMHRFIEGDIRILVTTAIIENGLDVPTANTMIVDRADLFGLAQLYQLRGRVGRSHHRAYCYLLIPEGVTEEAERRLRILEHYTELGSGYAIAMKDLELRGAGNILGADQSGFVHVIGLDTYTRLLEQTIRRLRGEADAAEQPPPEVGLDGAAYLPDEYVPESSQKLHLYRRLSRMEEPAEVAALGRELRDRFGPPPPEVQRLLASTALRLHGARLGVERVLLRGDEARVNFRAGMVPRLVALQGVFRDRQIEVEVRRTMPLSIVLRRYGAQPLVDTLVRAFGILVAERAQAA